MKSLDETHFVINLDYGKIPGFCGNTTVKYANVVSGGESMILIVRTSGGCHFIKEALTIIFTNKNMTYHIWRLIDYVLGVT